MIASVFVPIKTTSTNAKLRQHWRANRRSSKNERRVTALLMLAELDVSALKAQLPLRILVKRLSPGLLDGDNLQGALKAVRDEVAAVLGIDDADPRATWLYDQAKCKRGEHGVLVAFEEAA